MVLGHLSLAWLLRDIIPGSRRALLTIQADDVFLTTGGCNCAVECAPVAARGAGNCTILCSTSGGGHAHAHCPH